jgi:hypothetical protein
MSSQVRFWQVVITSVLLRQVYRMTQPVDVDMYANTSGRFVQPCSPLSFVHIARYVHSHLLHTYTLNHAIHLRLAHLDMDQTQALCLSNKAVAIVDWGH